MRMLPMLLVLCACEAEGTAFEAWHGEEDGLSLLFDDPHRDHSLRARIFDHNNIGEARLVSDGPPLMAGADRYELGGTEFIVVDAANRVRIDWSSHSVQLLLWLDRQTLDDVIAIPTTGTALDPRGDGFVQWPAGLSVEVLERFHARTLITVDFPEMQVQAAVPSADVDQVWEAFHEHTPPSYGMHRIHGPILDAPHGTSLAWPLIDEGVRVHKRGEAVDKHLPVRWSHHGVTVQGWVYEDDVVALDTRMGWGSSGGGRCGGAFGWGGLTNVPANTSLRSEPDGPVVGRTRRAMWVDFETDGWGTIPTLTPWGEAELWVDQLDLADKGDAPVD